MGTMSRYQCPRFGISPTRLLKATQARRELSGQRLLDVLSVIRHREKFNRACRRLVFAYWRRHCRKMRVSVVEGLSQFSGVTLPNDHPAFVQMRLLSRS